MRFLKLQHNVTLWICVWMTAQCCWANEPTIRTFQRTELTGTYYSEGIAVGDINGDGNSDVVYGPHWYAGPDFKDQHEIYPAVPQPTERYADHFFAWCYDFGQDGAQDVLTVGFPGTPAYVYQNPGEGEGKWTKHQILDWVSNESPQFVNLVGDEQPELVCTRDGFFGFATFDAKAPFEGWQFHPISEQIAAARFGHGLGIGDVNGDGRADIIHAGGWFEQPAEKATEGRWRPHSVSFSTGGGGAEMYAYDVDGDGDNDIITSESAHNFGLSWYEQTAPDEFKRHVIVGAHASENKYGVLFSEPHSVSLADMDGDGLLDIVTGKTYWSHHKQSPMWDAGAVVYWFKLERTPDGVDWLPFLAGDQTGIGRQVTVTDINGDGQLDIATGGMLGANILLQSVQPATDQEFQEWMPKVYQGPKPSNVDQGQLLRGAPVPIAQDGRVPLAIEGEELNASTTGGQTRVQPMGNFAASRWSGDSQLWWTGGRPGDRLTLQLDALQDIEAIQLALTCAKDYAIVEIFLDDQSLGKPIDLYNAEVISTGLLEFKTPKLKRGKHELAFEIVGANAAAVKSYMLGLDFVRFRGVDQTFPTVEDGIKPRAADGRELNLDFETGTLADWTATGEAFAGQPIQGDAVAARRTDMSSQHSGQYWIGGFEKSQDQPTGTLTSAPFRVTERYASFYVAGGASPKTRVELLAVGEDKPFFSISGRDSENLARVIVDLRRVEGQQMVIRLVDEHSGHWGHLNFDHFRLHASKPGPITPPSVPLVNDEYPHRGLPAEEAAAAMKLPPGFQAQVMAAEPDVKQPIAMTIDDRGRVWIAEAYEYPQRAEGDTGRDRILIFEDTTGDGRLDSRQVFCEGLNLVSGLEVGFGGVWVGAAPYLLFIPDRDGDDRPDSEPEILLDGWGYQDTHETLNAFCWGPDGWLYGCHGVFTHSRVGKPGTPDEQRIPINAGVWRYHPTRHEFEVFAHGTSNPWGVDFNAHGEAFITACVIPHLYHMISGGRYQRQGGQHFNPHTYDDIKTIADHLHYLGATPHSGNGKSDEAGGGHAHAGAMIYQGGLWPEEYHGVLFMNNIHGQRLNTDLLTAAGSGYVGSHGPDFLLTGDQASQILNMRYGPDGNVILIDWYDMQACHRREVEVHDRSNGRIYKINYQGEAGSDLPADAWQIGKSATLAGLSDVELAELCLHPNDWYVKHGRRLMQERASAGSFSPAALRKLAEIATEHADDTRRLRAMWAHHVVAPFEAALVEQLLADPSPFVRSWTLRLRLEQLHGTSDRDFQAQLQSAAATDGSPVVRRELASVLNRLAAPDRWQLMEALVREPTDVDDHNLPLLYWYAMEPLADVDADRALALAMSAGETIPQLREFMLRRLGGTGDSSAIDRLVAALAKAEEPRIQQTFLAAIQAALQGRRSAEKPSGWDRLYPQLANSQDTQVALQAKILALNFGDQDAGEALARLITDPDQDTSNRLQALAGLLKTRQPGYASLLEQLVSAGQVAPELRVAAIRGLADFDDPSIASLLIKRYAEFSSQERQAAVATLSGRAVFAAQLLDAIEQKQIPAVDLSADLARQIEYLEDKQLSQRLAAVWGRVRASSENAAEQIQQYTQLVARSDLPSPDVSMGRAIFAKTCQRCHTLYGVGEQLGPDLTGSNRSNLDYLLENIVDPSAVMAKEYQQSVFLTEDGQVITGIVLSETEQAVTIQTADRRSVLPKDEIAQRKLSEKSMMPDNQLEPFSDHEIRSLIAYLRGKAQVALPETQAD